MVSVGPLSVYYSYDTAIAFKVDGHPRVVLRNYWSMTTGKHLNWIYSGSREAKKKRVTNEVFGQKWQELVAPLLNVKEAPPPSSIVGSGSESRRRIHIR
jgi:hypothetical protein